MSRWLRRQLASEVVVHTIEEQSIRGWLEEEAPDGLILRAARFLDAGENPVPLAGETFIPRGRVAFVQVRP
ncbi:hypothetical protein GCM10009760_25800 [Kitasatospora kazusensis]|uniref:UTRA domain-containing protein n=1 Tax=Kitasatospora kazusensis TaxID=407974 RepID=A0ABP5L437_9ACTN